MRINFKVGFKTTDVIVSFYLMVMYIVVCLFFIYDFSVWN